MRLTLTYVDTHIAIWLGQGKLSKFPRKILSSIQSASELCLPAMVELELQVLYEIGKIKKMPQEIASEMRGLFKPCPVASFSEVCNIAQSLSWTRDLFDRLIVAEAMLAKAKLITADTNILTHYKKAVW